MLIQTNVHLFLNNSCLRDFYGDEYIQKPFEVVEKYWQNFMWTNATY